MLLSSQQWRKVDLGRVREVGQVPRTVTDFHLEPPEVEFMVRGGDSAACLDSLTCGRKFVSLYGHRSTVSVSVEEVVVGLS
jgi:hypothetical protein